MKRRQRSPAEAGREPGASGKGDKPPAAAPNVQGFLNTGSSCYIDSLLLAIYGVFLMHYPRRVDRIALENFKRSQSEENFWTVTRTDVRRRRAASRSMVCSDQDADQDWSIRREIQDALNKDIDRLNQGARIACSQVRTLLGKVCRLPGQPNLADRQNDPVELYQRLMSVFEYAPMVVHEDRTFANPQGEAVVIECRVRGDPYPSYAIPVNVAELWNWEESGDLTRVWNPRYFTPVDYTCRTNEAGEPIDNVGPKATLMNSQMHFDRLDTLVLNIIRGDPANVPVFQLPLDAPDWITFPSGPTGPSGPSGPSGAMKGQDASPVDLLLSSAIIHKGVSRDSAHYVTLLRASNRAWFLFDDLNPQGPQPISNDDARDLIARRSVMLFYFRMRKTRRDEFLAVFSGMKPEGLSDRRLERLIQLVLERPSVSLDEDVNRAWNLLNP